MNSKASRPPMVLTRLGEKTSAKGAAYYAGGLSAARVLVMENSDRRGGDDTTQVLMLAEYERRLTPAMIRAAGTDRFPPRPLREVPRC